MIDSIEKATKAVPLRANLSGISRQRFPRAVAATTQSLVNEKQTAEIVDKVPRRMRGRAARGRTLPIGRREFSRARGVTLVEGRCTWPKGPLKRDDFSSSHHPALPLCLSMIFFRKPVPTFRDHAVERGGPRLNLHRPPSENCGSCQGHRIGIAVCCGARQC